MSARPNQDNLPPDAGLARAALDALSAPICVLDATGIIIATNRAWQHFGAANGGDPRLTDEGSNYLRACEAFAATNGHGEALCVQLRQALAGHGEEFEFQYPCHAPGQRRWFSARVTPIRDGSRGRVLIAHIDVSAYRLAEIRAAAQAEVVTLIADHAPLGTILDALLRGIEAENPSMLCSVLLLDADGETLLHGAGPSLPAFYNEALHGLRIGPLIGSCGSAAYTRTRVVVADIQNDPRWQHHRELAARAGVRACWSEPLISRSGIVLGTFAIYQRECGAPSATDIMTITGAARIAAVAIERVRDEIALRTVENERNLLFECSLDLLCVADIGGRFKQVNPAWTRTLGWSQDELLRLGSYLELVHPDDYAATRQQGRDLLAGRPTLDFENRYRCRDGTYRLLSWNAFPLPQNGVTFAVVRDITERAAAESRRRAQDEHLRQRQKLEALGSLAGGIAHDFNNLLAIILGNAGLAQRSLEDGDDRLAQIELAARRATELVQQIMTFSRRQPRQLHIVPLCPIIEEALRLLRATIPAGIDIAMHCEPDAPAVLADATQMHQVIMNLCTNAWRALDSHPGKGARITVSVARCRDAEAVRAQVGADQMPPGPLLELAVADNGAGMDRATSARIFEPFFTTRETGEGTGLGLAVVHGIVAAHHGAITVDSTPGLGTTLRVYLPAASAEPHANPVAPPTPAPVSPIHPRAAQILYVDDEVQLVALACALFEEAGHVVSGYSTAAAALAALEAEPARFDVVVTDFNMPEYSGLDLARAVARAAPGLPVIIASGYVTPALQAEAAACGVRRLLSKNEYATTLVASVEAVLAEMPAST